MPAPEPGITLSTPHVSYAGGIQTGAASDTEWKAVRVVLAEMTPAVHALIVSPLLDCGLVAHPHSTLVRIFIGDQQLLIESCSTDARIVGLQIWELGVSHEFSLRFESSLEFWDFMRVVSEVMFGAEVRRADLIAQVPSVLDTMPSHGTSQNMRLLCKNEAHYSQSTNEAETL
ncbi:hypothetical protein C8T65DRAFT_745672 [Cerioporus squamosus]|nr:hypothetical protein C8T65DRAFT_745672 [Cerioporus squamosus]